MAGNITSAFGEKVTRRSWLQEPQLARPLSNFTIPAAAAITFYDGQALGRDAGGTIVQMDDTLKAEFVGFETDVIASSLTVNTTDSLGDKYAHIHRPLAFVCLIAAAAAGDEGKKVWWLYNNQVAYSGLTNWNFAGTVLGVIDSTHVLVAPPWLPGVTLGGDRGFVPITGTTTLTKWDVNKAQTLNFTTAKTITLPAAAKCSPGDTIAFININASSGTPTISPAGADQINGGSSYTGTTTQYGQFTLRTDGVSNWYVVTPNASGTLGATTFTGAITVAGAVTVTDAAAQAIAVGPNGATNPAFSVDGSVSSAATGVNIQGKAAGNGVLVQAISSTGGEALTLLGGASTASTAGGAITITGAIGGSSSGAGGAVTGAGGAGTAGNAAGGAVSWTGGAGQGNAAGGAASLIGGQGGATGAGGTITITGGAGGATSGAGAAVTITGGAGTASNSVGGAAALVGGAGAGTQAGGAITITSGAAGATGVAGAVNISVGAATAGNGSAVTITGGNGAGGTNSGGNINLVPGTAVSTGTPGEIQVNSSAGLFEAIWSSGISTAAIPASGSVVTMFMADRAYRVKYVSVIEATFGTSETYTFKKDTGTTAPGGGTAICTGAVTPAVSNTRVTGTLSGTVATITLAAGDRLSFTIGGTVGSAAGATVAIGLVPV